MMEEIPKYPDIPDILREAAFQKKLVPFIGAGVSTLAGYPNWDGLAKAAISYLIDTQKFSHAQLDQIIDLPPRVKLSLAVGVEDEHNVQIDFRSILTYAPQQNIIRQKLYGNVARLWRFAEIFVTTNYDEELENPIPTSLTTEREGELGERPIVVPEPVYRLPDITVHALGRANAVVHIHGSVRERESMVLTTPDYLRRYQGHRTENGQYIENKFLTFLIQIFATRNALFIGYGLAELEILEYVIQKGLDKRSSLPHSKEQPRHFVLWGFFSHQRELAGSLKSYFRSFGIQLLPFSRDERDWESLIDVLEKLCADLPAGARLTSMERLEMEELLA